jgi:hypothetical protein
VVNQHREKADARNVTKVDLAGSGLGDCGQIETDLGECLAGIGQTPRSGYCYAEIQACRRPV